jgi:hypothetical protein
MEYQTYTGWVYEQYVELLKAARGDVDLAAAPIVAAILTVGVVVGDALGGQLDT